jgi:hypothetical protein
MLGVATMSPRSGLAVGLLVALLAAGCSDPSAPAGVGHAAVRTSASATPSDNGGPGEPLGGLAKYADAVDAAHRHGLAVWLETDLVTRWRQGPRALAAGVRRAAELSTHRGVVGVKIADELGEDDGLDSREQVLAFLADASAALRRVLPRSSSILVDVVVPELGCAPGDRRAARYHDACVQLARQRYPGATVAVVDALVASGTVDVVDVSTGLLDPQQYADWGITRQEAQRAAWREIARLGWSKQVRVHARKAMAVPLPFTTTHEAAAAVPTYVDVPVAGGAQAVDIWTWCQQYDGARVGLMDRHLRPNALWQALLARRARGVDLLTHFTPSQLQRGLDADLAAIATVFSGVFVAAGTG